MENPLGPAVQLQGIPTGPVVLSRPQLVGFSLLSWFFKHLLPDSAPHLHETHFFLSAAKLVLKNAAIAFPYLGTAMRGAIRTIGNCDLNYHSKHFILDNLHHGHHERRWRAAVRAPSQAVEVVVRRSPTSFAVFEVVANPFPPPPKLSHHTLVNTDLFWPTSGAIKPSSDIRVSMLAR